MKWESAPPFDFEVGGSTYTVTPIGERGYTEYLNWQAIMSGEKPTPPPEAEGAMLLGDAYQKMLDDNVPAAAIRRAMLTIITDLRMTREAAETVWERGLDPEALAPTKSGAAEPASTPSSSTGEASVTRKRASTTGTSSPKTTKRTRKRQADSHSQS